MKRMVRTRTTLNEEDGEDEDDTEKNSDIDILEMI